LTTPMENRVKCPKCGRMAPARIFCVFCGERLRQTSSMPRSADVREEPISINILPPESVSKTSEKGSPRIDTSISELMKEISLVYEWKIKLLGLFNSDEITQDIFSKLYNEYGKKLNDLLNKRSRKTEELRSSLREKEAELKDSKFSLKELEIRHMVGELGLEDFKTVSERVKLKTNGAEVAAKEINNNLSALEQVLPEKTPKEIYEMEKTIRSAHEKLDRMISEGKLNREETQNIRADVDNMLETFDSINKPRKEKMKAVQEKLNIIDARFKVGEIAIEVYEKQKREFEDQLDKIWT